MERSDHHRFSAGDEIAASIGSFVVIIAAIILHAYVFGPIGSGGPASHAGAGFAEIGLMILTFGMFTAGTITRMVYRAWPMRWLKVASMTYFGLLIFSGLLGFIDVGGTIAMVFLTAAAGLAVSLLLLFSYCVKRLSNLS